MEDGAAEGRPFAIFDPPFSILVHPCSSVPSVVHQSDRAGAEQPPPEVRPQAAEVGEVCELRQPVADRRAVGQRLGDARGRERYAVAAVVGRVDPLSRLPRTFTVTDRRVA